MRALIVFLLLGVALGCNAQKVKTSALSYHPVGEKDSVSVGVTHYDYITKDSISVDIPAAIQKDIDGLNAAIQELNSADYVKKQTELLQSRANLIYETFLKSIIDPANVERVKLVPGKLIIKFKPR